MTIKTSNRTDLTPADNVTMLIGSALSALIDGWLMLLLLGYLHTLRPGIPAWGLWPCILISWVVANIVGSGTAGLTFRIRKLATL